MIYSLKILDTLKELVLCMPHRGRLNFLTGMLRFPAEKLFRKLRGLPEFPDDAKATGDVISHFVSSTELPLTDMHVSMLYNPSHLEAVNPVSMGRTRGLMQILKDGAYSDDPNAQWSDKVLNVQVYIQNRSHMVVCLQRERIQRFVLGSRRRSLHGSRSQSRVSCTEWSSSLRGWWIHSHGGEQSDRLHHTSISWQVLEVLHGFGQVHLVASYPCQCGRSRGKST